MLDTPSGIDAPTRPDPSGAPAAPPTRGVFVAARVCPETARLGREVRFPLAVAAATADPARHAAKLAGTIYGTWTPQAYQERPLPFDEGLALVGDLATVADALAPCVDSVAEATAVGRIGLAGGRHG